MSEPLTKLKFSKFVPFFEAEGFPISGAVDYDLALPTYHEHALRYQAWIEKGKQGAMEYLKRGLDRKLNPLLVFPELKSVITVAMPYGAHPVGDESARYARYLNGPDYHELMKAKLESAITRLRAENYLPDNFQYKICVDTSAVLERTWAILTGLGWVGRNTLLIHPQLGSYLFLGVIFTNSVFSEAPKILKDYCGSCTRCLSACPTGALDNHDLDSRKCISYLTLEKRGEWEQEYPLKGFLAGCDLCQDVCPYNSKAVRYTEAEAILPHLICDLETLSEETEVEYRERVKGTALSRVKYADFRRNLKSVISSQMK